MWNVELCVGVYVWEIVYNLLLSFGDHTLVVS